MTKILNFALKIKGGRKGGTCEVLRPCHPLPKNLERALDHWDQKDSLQV